MPHHAMPARSEEVDDLLGMVPSWITRAGNVLLWMVFAILLTLSWFVQYPDVVPARITITALEPPVRLVAPSSGRLDKLLIGEGQTVAHGDWLGILESAADYRDVRRVIALLPEIERRLGERSLRTSAPIELPENLKLGPLHVAYSALTRSVRSYQLFCKAGYHDKKIALLTSQARWQRQIASRSRLRLEIVERELALSATARDRERELQVAGVSSAVDAENAESSLEQKRRLGTEVQANLFDQELRIQEYEKAQLDLERERDERDQEFLLAIQHAYKTLYSEISDWEQRVVIRSPLDGRVTLHKVGTNYHVTTGTEVMAVLPNRTTLLGRIELGQHSSGKVAIGQRVNVMLDGYPFREFGVLCGTVQAIAPIAQAGSYIVDVSFTGDELRSSFGRRLEFKDGMQGSADIVTEDLRLIERILGKVLYAVKQPGAR